MVKPKLLYASPFWPLKSGISEYSETLVYALSCYFEITLLTDDYSLRNEEIKKEFPIIVYEKGVEYTEFDYILYNIGNQPDYHGYMYDAIMDNPGDIIMHDYSLYYLTVGYYSKKGAALYKIYEMGGPEGIQAVKRSLISNSDPNLLLHKDLPAKLPLNTEILNAATGVLVHSDYSKNLIIKQGKYENVAKINFPFMISSKHKDSSKDYLYERHAVPKDAIIAVSAGFIAPTKQNDVICEAVRFYNKTHAKRIYYIMVGEGGYVDKYIDDFIIKTGFVTNDEYWYALQRSDIVLNLRYPTNGETSATLIECMWLGKPCFVTDIDWFSELPDESVIKLPHDITAMTLADMFESFLSGDNTAIKENAVKYVTENCASEKVAESIYELLKKHKIENDIRKTKKVPVYDSRKEIRSNSYSGNHMKYIEFGYINNVPSGGNNEMTSNLSYLNSNCSLNSNGKIVPNRKILGRLIVIIKRAIRKCLRWYIDPINDQQTRFNEHNTRILNHLVIIVETMHLNVDNLNKNVDQLNKNIDSLNHHNDYIKRKVDLMNEDINFVGSFARSIRQGDNNAYNATLKKTPKSHVTKTIEAKGSLNDQSFNYFLFENRYRGTREHVKNTQRKYLRFYEGKQGVLDIGCGRGEFLELLLENEIECKGIDINDSFVKFNQQKGRSVILVDALDYLSLIEDNTLEGVFMSHVLEHLTTDYLFELLLLIYEKLKLGCFLVAETPNPTSLAILNNSFYLDPSHVKPLHPYTMQFLLEQYGYNDIELIYSSRTENQIPELYLDVPGISEYNEAMKGVNDALFGYQDYAIVGKK